ncbi:MAG: hypothetical protein PHS60_17100, partial [Zavarzinia sp.]|nr:hypothetical protein [Zavarzinia sp.]
MKRTTPFVCLIILAVAVAGCRSRTPTPATVDGATVVGTVSSTSAPVPETRPAVSPPATPTPLATPDYDDDRARLRPARARVLRGTGTLVGA